MTLDDVLRLMITGLVGIGIAALLTAIVVANVYAIVHAWRSERVVWALVLTALFLMGGGVATAVYLFIYHDEPMPRAASSKSCAPA